METLSNINEDHIVEKYNLILTQEDVNRLHKGQKLNDTVCVSNNMINI